ncbi:MAG: triose-phosphate isomerase [Bacilli bacterium]|jgi:triosephosphate isomerase|nr:triose-phosphate isomerase [Bacilli bacterium]
MESKKIVVGNMKMNLLAGDISEYLRKINSSDLGEQVVICPSNIYVPYFLKQSYKVGVQNLFFRDSGAYTGEISAAQVASMGVKYAIIGHSERRGYFRESDQDINKKVVVTLKYGLEVILCIGETAEEKNLLKTARVLKRQILNALRNLEEADFDHIVIAYEPVWAIGTNVTPTNKDITDTISYIKGIVSEYFRYEDIPVIYGGSVNDQNIKDLNTIPNVSGFLVGGASTDVKKFLKIVEVAVKK